MISESLAVEVESVLSDLLARCNVRAVVELHRIEVDGVE